MPDTIKAGSSSCTFFTRFGSFFFGFKTKILSKWDLIRYAESSKTVCLSGKRLEESPDGYQDH